MNARLGLILGSLLLFVAFSASAQTSNRAPALALVIVYDGSGSMGERVPDLQGKPMPKFEIANNAVLAIAKKVQDHCAAKNVTVDAGLVLFTEARVREALPLQDFDIKRFNDWAMTFGSPSGGTPLGKAIAAADNMLRKSKALKKHILVVTDGESNEGETPANTLKRLNLQKSMTSVYFVAFDVSAKVFAPLKKLGATVVSAANEAELKTQLDMLLGQKILLEAE